MPHVLCPSCRLSSYAVTPHSRTSLCPYCDAELFPALRAPKVGAEDERGVERKAEAA